MSTSRIAPSQAADDPLSGRVAAERDPLRDLLARQTELEHRLVDQRRLLEVTARLVSKLDPDGVLELIADSLREVVTYDTLTIYRLDRAEERLVPVLSRDRFADLIMGSTFPCDQGITGWVIAHGEAQMVNDARADPRMALIPGTPDEREALIVVPLVVGGEVMGTLNLGRIGGPEVAFTERDFEITRLLGERAAMALHNALTHRAATRQAETDPLTGLPNRAGLHRRFEELLAEAGRNDLSLLMLDLDHFKTFNDQRGHPAGDRVLAAIAGAFRTALRESDSVYRYGGDEFAALLPGTGTVHACEIGERVCAAVREAGRSAGARVTLSVGVATSPHDGRTGSELIDVADGALYRAKLAGGDRVAFRAGLWSIEARSTRARPRRATGRRSPASEEHRLRARVDQLTALYQTAVSLLDSLDPDQLIREILERAGELLATPHGYLYLVTPDRSALELRLGLGEFERHVGLRLAPGEGVAGSVWASGEPLNVDDYSAWAGRSPQFPGPFRATVGAPLTSRGEVIGVLGLAYLRQGRTFDDDQVALLSRFAQLASVALRNARLYDEANRELASARHEEEQARRSEALFRALAEHSTELIGIIDADGRPRFVSPSNLRVLGYTPEELRQADPFALPHPDDVAAVREAFGRVVSRPGSSITLRYRLRHKDGRWLHVEGTATNLLHDDIVRGIVVNSRILHDHERKPSGQAREGRLDCRPRSRTGTSNRAKRAPASRDGASRRQGSAANGPARPAEAPR